MAATEHRHWWYAATRALLAEQLAPFLPPGGRFLDAGGGTGATGAWLAADGRLVAADLEPRGRCRSTGEQHPEVTDLAVADLARLPFAGRRRSTLALSVTVLYHAAVDVPGGRRRASWPGSCARAASWPCSSPACAGCAGPTTARPTPGAGSRCGDLRRLLVDNGARGGAGHRRLHLPGAAGGGAGPRRPRRLDQRPRPGPAGPRRRAARPWPRRAGRAAPTSGRRSGCRSWPSDRVRA